MLTFSVVMDTIVKENLPPAHIKKVTDIVVNNVLTKNHQIDRMTAGNNINNFCRPSDDFMICKTSYDGRRRNIVICATIVAICITKV